MKERKKEQIKKWRREQTNKEGKRKQRKNKEKEKKKIDESSLTIREKKENKINGLKKVVE